MANRVSVTGHYREESECSFDLIGENLSESRTYAHLQFHDTCVNDLRHQEIPVTAGRKESFAKCFVSV